MQSLDSEGLGDLPEITTSDPAAAAILELLRHLQVLAMESGKADMAEVIDGAMKRCVQLHVSEKRRELEEMIVQGRMQ